MSVGVVQENQLQERRILVLRKTGTEQYELPGGKRNRGESPEETAVRFLRDQTGSSEHRGHGLTVHSAQLVESAHTNPLTFNQNFHHRRSAEAESRHDRYEWLWLAELDDWTDYLTEHSAKTIRRLMVHQQRAKGWTDPPPDPKRS